MNNPQPVKFMQPDASTSVVVIPLQSKTRAMAVLLAGLYKLAIACGGLAIVWNGGSPWVLVLIVPLLILGPRK